MSMRSALLLLPPLLALLAAPRVSAEKPVLFRLCGRDLMRAVIYTCGASRWRREARPNEMLAEDQKPLFVGFHPSKRLLAQRLGSFSGEDSGYRPDLLEEMLAVYGNPSRDKRLFNQTHAELCCRRGCTKKQMSFLC